MKVVQISKEQKLKVLDVYAKVINEEEVTVELSHAERFALLSLAKLVEEAVMKMTRRMVEDMRKEVEKEPDTPPAEASIH